MRAWGLVDLGALGILPLWLSICEGLGGVVNILQNILGEEEKMGVGHAILRCTLWKFMIIYGYDYYNFQEKNSKEHQCSRGCRNIITGLREEQRVDKGIAFGVGLDKEFKYRFQIYFGGDI